MKFKVYTYDRVLVIDVERTLLPFKTENES